jgi:hypothetical protein
MGAGGADTEGRYCGRLSRWDASGHGESAAVFAPPVATIRKEEVPEQMAVN